MTENQAKKQLKKMLRSYTPGSILHLLSDLYKEAAEVAESAGEALAYQQCRLVEATLVVVGMGLDAACPR